MLSISIIPLHVHSSLCSSEKDKNISQDDSKKFQEDVQKTTDEHIKLIELDFKEKEKERKLNISAIDEYPEIEICDYQNLKDGKDYVLESGELVNNQELTFDPDRAKSFAYLSDTSYKPDICELISKCDLIYHESTFLKTEEALAKKTKHSTAEQAAKIAEQAKVKTLLLLVN